MIFATNFVRQPVILVAGMALLAMISVSVQGQGVAKPVKLKHTVIAEPVFGAIRPRGYLPVRITIDRQGTQAVAQRDITYFVYQSNWFYRSNTYNSHLSTHRLVLPRGKTNVSGIFLMQELTGGGWNSGIFVETDGNLRDLNRSGDIASLRLPKFLNNNSSNNGDASKVRCLFVSPTPDIVPNQSFVFHESGLGSANPWNVVQSTVLADDSQATAESLADSEIPAAWALQRIVEQENEVRYDPFSGTPNQPVEPLIPLGNPSRAENLQALRHFEYMGHVTPNELPDFWQAFVPIDYMFVSAAELKSIQANLPTTWNAIREWVVAGGRLVLVECGPRCEALQAIERDWFDLAQGEVRNLWKRTSLSKIRESRNDWAKKWQSLPVADPYSGGPQSGFSPHVIHPEIDSSGMADFPFRDSTELSLQDCYLTAHCWSPKAEPFGFASELAPEEVLVSDFGAGCIVASSGNCSDWSAADWKTVLAAGMASAPGPLLAQNTQVESSFFFSTLSMPGLGDPPWFLFMGMITFFAIGVGPVAYSILASRKKIPWILGLVPVVAGTLTVGLLAFAILSEGLGTRAVRCSVTRMDQVSGRAFTKTHFTVYSGTSPGSYVFDRHKLVFPNMGTGFDSKSSSLEDTQQFSGGDIRARTIHQLALAEPNQTDSQLRINKIPGDGASWEVVNQTGATLSPFVANTDDGWLVLEQLDEGQPVELQPVDTARLIDALDKMIANSDHRLGHLEKLKNELSGTRNNLWGRTIYSNPNYYYEQRSWQTFGNIWPPDLMTSPATIANSVPVGSWLGMTDNWKLAGQLTAGTNYSRDFHLIHGRWK